MGLIVLSMDSSNPAYEVLGRNTTHSAEIIEKNLNTNKGSLFTQTELNSNKRASFVKLNTPASGGLDN